MKKKLLALCLVCLMLLSALPVSAAKSGFNVEIMPLQQTAVVGDTVYYSVVAEAADVVALQFELEIPKGMSYVKGSGAVADGLQKRLGVAGLDWTEGSMLFSFYNDTGVTIPSGTQLMIFACVAQTEGSHQVGLKNVLPFNSEFEEVTSAVETVKVTVLKEAQPEPEITVPDEDLPSQDPDVQTSEPQKGESVPDGSTGETNQPGEVTGTDTPAQPGEVTGTDVPAQPGEVTGSDTSSQPGEVTGTDQLQPGETEQGQTPDETAPQEQQPQSPEGNEDTTSADGEKTQPDTQSTSEQEEGTDLTVLWIILAVAAVAAGAVVVFLRKKKASAEKQG